MTEEPCPKKAKLCSPEESESEEVTDNSIEKRFHISCYTENSSSLDSKPVKCIMKHRFSDFIVNEIDERSEVVQLTSFDIPEIGGAEEEEEIADVGEVLSEKEESVITEAVKGKTKSWIKLTQAPEDKNKRRVIHTFISNKYNNIISKTEDGFINVKFSPGQKEQRGRMRVAWDSNKLGGKFCSFVLYKEGLSTVEAIDAISYKLHRPTSCFTFGGTKDKRGITTQRVTAFKIFASTLSTINEKLDKVKVGNFTYTNDRLGLGALTGNRFQLLLRGIQKTDVPVLTERAERVANNGFINYFGLQRFGSVSSDNQEVGRSILKNEWANVLKRVLFSESCKSCNKFMSAVEKEFNSSGTIKVLSEDMYRMKLGIEKKFLTGLQKCGCDSDEKIREAFSFVSRPMRTMYVHAYQAYLWNMMASERISQLGLKLCVGDLVLTSSGEIVSIDGTNVTQYSIFDCVIPVLGSESQIPPNLKDFCSKVLEQDSIVQSDFKRNKDKDYNMGGDYRKLVVKTENFKFSFLSYNKPDEDLLKSDLQLMTESTESENCEISEDEGKFWGLKLTFDLPKSAYATMLIREITFCDTSQQFNKKESDDLNTENGD